MEMVGNSGEKEGDVERRGGTVYGEGIGMVIVGVLGGGGGVKGGRERGESREVVKEKV